FIFQHYSLSSSYLYISSLFFFYRYVSPRHLHSFLHDALPIFVEDGSVRLVSRNQNDLTGQFAELRELPKFIKAQTAILDGEIVRSEEHTSELQSHLNLVCRLLLEKKKD